MNLPDFDQLLELSRHAPEQLESIRQSQVQQLIARADPRAQQRLRGLQFQIDAQRAIHKNPLGACVKISQMMSSSFHTMISLLKEPPPEDDRRAAKLLTFQTRETEHEVL